MAEVNEELIQSDRFRKELESLIRNGDPNVLTGSKVRRDIEKRLGLEEDSLRAQPWRTQVNNLLDEILIQIQQEDVDMDQPDPESQATEKDDVSKSEAESVVPEKKAMIKSEKEELVKLEEVKSGDSAIKKEEAPNKVDDPSNSEPSDKDSDEEVVKKPTPRKKRAPQEKKNPSTKTSKAKTKKEKSPAKKEVSSDDEIATTKTKGRKKTGEAKGSSTNDEKLKKLKMYINKCGVRKKWSTELDGLSQSQQIKKLQSILQDLGVEGRPTLDKCEKAKHERELKAEIASLDTENILDDEGNGRRGTRRSQPVKRKRHIISSDEDEDDDRPSKVSSTGLDISFLGDQGSDSD